MKTEIATKAILIAVSIAMFGCATTTTTRTTLAPPEALARVTAECKVAVGARGLRDDEVSRAERDCFEVGRAAAEVSTETTTVATTSREALNVLSAIAIIGAAAVSVAAVVQPQPVFLFVPRRCNFWRCW